MNNKNKNIYEHSRLLHTIISLLDLLLIVICTIGSYYFLLKYNAAYTHGVSIHDFILISIACYLPASVLNPPLLLSRFVKMGTLIPRVLRLTTVQLVAIILCFFVIDEAFASRIFILTYYVGFSFLLVMQQILLRFYVKKRLNRRNKIQRVILFGDSEQMLELYHDLKDCDYGYKIIGVYCNDQQFLPKSLPLLGDLEHLTEHLENGLTADCVYTSQAELTEQQNLEVFNYCENHIIRYHTLPNISISLQPQMSLSMTGQQLIFSPREEPLADWSNKIIKRTLDFTVSLIFLLTFYPFIYIIVAYLIKKQSAGPIHCKQKCCGANGKTFTCLTFRTTHLSSQADEDDSEECDSRDFRFGHFMRRTNMDKLPQFLCVLSGTMSLVGPCPHTLLHTEEYGKLVNKYRVRHWVKPGITGWAQIKGLRGETQEIEQMKEQVSADIWYVGNWSYGLDLRILWRTLLNIIQGKNKNAY